MLSKLLQIEQLLEYGFIKAYLFLLTTTLAFVNLVTIIVVLFISWWHRVR